MVWRELRKCLCDIVVASCGKRMMSAIAVNELLQIPETLEKLVFPSSSASSRAHHESAGHQDTKGLSSVAVDILESPRDYTFYIDVPGLSKSDIQVTVEDEKTLVIRSNVKRKREEDAEEDGVKYIRWERKRTPFKFLRKFRLPDDSIVSAISAKCENGVLTVTVEKLPPPQKSKTVQVAIS